MPWLYLELSGRQIRVDSEDSSNICVWREYKTKPDDWIKRKPTLQTNKEGYKKYVISINKQYILSRVIYKAHNPDWDITDGSDTNNIDHINNNSLDNRIENLRILTHQQNQFNRTNPKGYNWHKNTNKWRAHINFNNKKIHIGYYDNEADAAQAYLTAKEKYHKMPI